MMDNNRSTCYANLIIIYVIIDTTSIEVTTPSDSYRHPQSVQPPRSWICFVGEFRMQRRRRRRSTPLRQQWRKLTASVRRRPLHHGPLLLHLRPLPRRAIRTQFRPRRLRVRHVARAAVHVVAPQALSTLLVGGLLQGRRSVV